MLPGVAEQELPEEFGDVLLPRWMKDASGLHRVGFELTVRLPQHCNVAEIGSPSHAIKVRRERNGQYRVSLAPDKDLPDRDVVLDVRTDEALSGLFGGIAKDGRAHFAVLQPSSAFGRAETGPRRVVFVIDRSGSMCGLPIFQAKSALEACLGALGGEDTFGLVAFNHGVELMRPGLLSADKPGREIAQRFLESLEACGGTELAAGLRAAAELLHGKGGDVLVLTDGQVAGTETIINTVRSTPIRVHCLGIGSASKDRFLALLARETGGTSRFLTARERVDMGAVELFSSMSAPVACNVKIEGLGLSGVTIAPEPPATVFAGNPLLLFGEANGTNNFTIRVAWEGASDRQHLEVPVALSESAEAEAVALLQGARLITDIESRLENVVPLRAGQKRETDRQMEALRKLSMKYGLASRAMSLVAVIKRKGDRPGEVPKTMVVPVGMPQGTAFELYIDYFGGTVQAEPSLRIVERCWLEMSPPAKHSIALSPAMINIPEADLLIQLAGLLEPDGGLPGRDEEDRWIGSATVLFCFFAHGHTGQTGAFRVHVQRLLSFLKTSAQSSTDHRKRRLVELAELRIAPQADWDELASAITTSNPVAHDRFWQAVSVLFDA